MPVCIHAGEVARLVNISAELRMNGTGMAVLMLLAEVGHELAHDIQKIVLKIFKVEAVDIVRAFLYHDRACGMVGGYADSAVFYSGLLHYLAYLL